MRIAVDLTALLPQRTGVDHYLIQLILHLGQIDRCNQYKIFVTYEDRNAFEGQLPGNFTICPRTFRPRPSRLLFQQGWLPLIAHRWGADVVHSPSFIMPLIRGRQRHVVTIHDMTSFSLPEYHIPLRRSAAYRRVVTHSIEHSDLVLVPSEFVKQDLLRWVCRSRAERIQVIPLGIDADFRPKDQSETRAVLSRLGLPPSYILFVGTLEPRKNLEKLIESYRRLVAMHGVVEHLVLAGKLGWAHANLSAQLDTTELRDKVHLIGYVAREDLPYIYSGATVFVYPSWQEGFGLPPLEAMACGVPTVSSNSSSLYENLAGAAELVDPENVDALSRAIRRFLEDPSLRAVYRRLGRARASGFRWQETARQTLQCYRTVAENGRAE